VTFCVPGVPRPQGSKTLMRGRLLDANAARLRPWREAVALVAAAAAACPALLTGPVRVSLTFTLPRPASHPLRPRSEAVRERVRLPIGRGTGDVDKLARAVLDSLTGTVYVDDAQVVDLWACKVYGAPGVQVTVERVPLPVAGVAA